MPFTSEAIVPCTSSSNKISPVDTDLPLAETESLEPKGPEVDQDLVELARELSKNSGSEEPGSSRSQGRTEVDVGAKELEQLSQEGLDNLATEGTCMKPPYYYHRHDLPQKKRCRPCGFRHKAHLGE